MADFETKTLIKHETKIELLNLKLITNPAIYYTRCYMMALYLEIMTSKILITNIQNIDFEKMQVIDNSKVLEEKYDSDMDVLLLENKNNGSQRMSNLMNVSLFDDLIVKNNEKFKILRMLSR